MNDLPLISIGVSTYNRKDYLKLSLDSLLNQTYPNCEIIVVDDGSADNTGEMVKALYPQVKYVYQANAGDAAAKNHAARLAQGEYIVFNDSDDLFLPDAVERLYNAVKDKEKTAISYGTYTTIDPAGKELPTKRKAALYPSGKITGNLLEHIVVCNCGTLIPLEIFRKANMFDTALKVSYDYALFLELSLNSKFYAVQQPVFLRRRHNSNMSSANYGKMLTVLKIVEDFTARHSEIATQYPRELNKRLADLHNKLCREARKEKRAAEAKMHAKTAFSLQPTLKNFFRTLGW